MELLTKEQRTDLRKLKAQSTWFTRIAWTFVAFGVIFFGIGLFIIFNDTAPEYSELGDFVGGTAGSLWALAGLFFIYVAFLGQKEQLIYQMDELKATREELKGQKRQLALQNEQYGKQLRTVTYPHLHVDVDRYTSALPWSEALKEVPNSINLSISNYSSVPAYDVDVLVLAEYLKSDITASKFKADHLRGPHKKSKIPKEDSDSFDVFDHIRYPFFHSRARVLSKVEFPLPIHNVNILIWFRDIFGDYYCRVFYFSDVFKRADKEEYKLISALPSSVDPIPKLTWESVDGALILQTESGDKFPAYLEDFKTKFSNSVHVSFTKIGSTESHDRGAWSDL